jgi:hypothetical protein
MAAGRRAWMWRWRANRDTGVGSEEAPCCGEPVPCSGGGWEPSESSRQRGPVEGNGHQCRWSI